MIKIGDNLRHYIDRQLHVTMIIFEQREVTNIHEII